MCSMTRAERDQRNALIEMRLSAGATCSELARELGCSTSVVSTVALRAGHRSGAGPPKQYDWSAIRAFYETGRSKRECRERFGFSAGAWDSAVNRGEIKLRPRADPVRHSHDNRRRVAQRLEDGQTQAQIARDLGISKGTVAFHVRNLGIAADRRFSRRYDWAEIQRSYDAGLSALECRVEFGCSGASWSQAVKRGDLIVRPRRAPLVELLARGPRRNRYHLKQRLIEAGLKNRRCELCGLSEWRGQPISLELHHVNGDALDNRLESLQILCPNCHSQTENFGRRNAQTVRAG